MIRCLAPLGAIYFFIFLAVVRLALLGMGALVILPVDL